jgi:hypothetical protein
MMVQGARALRRGTLFDTLPRTLAINVPQRWTDGEGKSVIAGAGKVGAVWMIKVGVVDLAITP